VQKLNREGVEAVRKHRYARAEALFYKAYLFDPDDPFTLNNLGYVSELKGDVDRAAKYYALAAKGNSDAIIDQSSLASLKGKPLDQAFTRVEDVGMKVNQANVKAIRLLSEDRVREADDLLQQTVTLDPGNPFTLNNLGLAKEMQGDFAGALDYYQRVASAGSKQPVIVTLNSRWRGKPVSEMAAESVKKVRQRLREQENPEARAALLNLRGVSAVNRNDWQAAAQDFGEAYQLNPDNAFSLNNRGFLAEMNGDMETAQDFYRKAREAHGDDARIGVATQTWAVGVKLSDVADDNDQKMQDQFEAERKRRQQETGPIQLRRRDNSPVIEPQQPSAPVSPEESPSLGPPQPPVPQLDPNKPPPGDQNNKPQF
jgi:Flp pilus assembly protein TadD